MDLSELRADVREALAAGRGRVELVYVDEDDYQRAARAMLADGHDVTELRMGSAPGGCIVVRSAESLPLDPSATA